MSTELAKPTRSRTRCANCRQRTDAEPLDDGNVLCDECRKKLPTCGMCGWYTPYIYYFDDWSNTDPPIAVCGRCFDVLEAVEQRNREALNTTIRAYFDEKDIALEPLDGFKAALQRAGLWLTKTRVRAALSKKYDLSSMRMRKHKSPPSAKKKLNGKEQ